MESTLVTGLVQPLLSTHPEPRHHSTGMLPLSEFLNLLREEEDYYQGDQHNTKLMITRLRKIFYDKWGWNTQLIKGASNIEGRYEVDIVDPAKQPEKLVEGAKEVRRIRHDQEMSKYRSVTYKKDDRQYPERAGETPLIYADNHQEVLLPDGYCCDMAHILAGLDAFNHPQVVCPLPAAFSFLYRLFPHVDSNAAVVTWLGDIATSAGSFILDFVRNNGRAVSRAKEQDYINDGAPGSDMLGNIDAYVIHTLYDVSGKGRRITDILEEYYCGGGQSQIYREHRFSMFCNAVGLEEWDGEDFANESEWLWYFEKQLRNNTSFQVYSLTEEGLNSIWLPLKIWRGRYNAVLKAPLLLSIFLEALKAQIKQEPIH